MVCVDLQVVFGERQDPLGSCVEVAQKLSRMILNSAVFSIEPCKASAPEPDPKASISSTVFSAEGA